MRKELVERAAALRGYLHFEGKTPRFVYDASDPEEAFFVREATRYYQIYNAATGELVERSPEIKAMGFQYTPSEIRDLLKEPDVTMLQTDQASLLLRREIVRASDRTRCLLQVGVSLEPRDTSLNRFLQITFWLLPLGVLLAVLSGWWMARQLLAPIESLNAAVREISISQLDRRLPVRGAGDELDQLATTFNEVFARLDKAVSQMKGFTANISHELRTPLTVLRGEAEIALARATRVEDFRRVIESQLEELEKLSHMVNQMLTLAKAEAGQIRLARDKVDLAALARTLAEQMEAVAAARGIVLTVRSNGPVVVFGDEGWLERAILNLLDNAVKFTQEGGLIEVRVQARSDRALLEVRDNGVGISPQALPHIFERLYREDSSRSKQTDGTGLGLSLVQWIVQQHHGQVSADSQPERGSTFRMELPLAPLSSP